MIDTNKLRGVIAEKGYHQTDVAKKLDITPKTFYIKMSKGIFLSNEIEEMINFLHIDDPVTIFFANRVTQ